MADIAYQNKDITAKTMAETLRGKSLSAFGLKDLVIVDILPTNLPAIESNELRLDNLFLLNDGSVALIDYESVFDKESFVKYLGYVARVIKRYAVNHQLSQLKKLRIIIIYTADVEWSETIYDLGGVILTVEASYLIHLDTEASYRKIKQRIESGASLTEEELMELMILPLTVKGKPGKQELIIAAVKLAKQLPERTQTIQALAGILTFSDKVIDNTYKKRIKEEMLMTQVGQMLIDEGIEAGKAKGEVLKLISMIRKKLAKGYTVTQTADALEEAPDTILPIFTAIKNAPAATDEMILDRVWEQLGNQN